MLDKLDIIKAAIEVKDSVKNMSILIANLSKLFVVDQSVDVDDGDSEDLFLHCRSIVDIEVNVAVFMCVNPSLNTGQISPENMVQEMFRVSNSDILKRL